MLRKIVTIASTAFVIGTLAVAPHIADAQVTISAAVASAATVSSNTDVATTTWTGAAAEVDPFTVSVTSNDPAGYTFTFTDSQGSGAFALAGTAVPGNVVHYTVTDATPFTYVNGTAGSTVEPGPTTGAVPTTFDVNLPVQANVPADTYSDTLTVAVNPQ